MDTITLGDMRDYTTERTQFKNSTESVFSKKRQDLYVVYSYGEHFPMYVYDHGVELWFGNADKYSPTTSKNIIIHTTSDFEKERRHYLIVFIQVSYIELRYGPVS